jgi:glycolate oxidase FAD binding subunit
LVQATGIATLRLEGDAKAFNPAIEQIRAELESSRSSLVVLSQPAGLKQVDAWGSPGDSISLMRAVKYQLDPKNTLNPGRFVGGI